MRWLEKSHSFGTQQNFPSPKLQVNGQDVGLLLFEKFPQFQQYGGRIMQKINLFRYEGENSTPKIFS